MKINDPLPGLSKTSLLEALKERTEEATSEMLLPVQMQKGDAEESARERAASVYIGRLPDTKQNTKKAPYILHQMVNSANKQRSGEQLQSKAIVRSIFCVYCDDEQEGTLMLINLMERLRISLLKNPLIGNNVFECDLSEEDGAGLEDLVYPDDTYPYYLGELISVWDLPPIKREVRYW